MNLANRQGLQGGITGAADNPLAPVTDFMADMMQPQGLTCATDQAAIAKEAASAAAYIEMLFAYPWPASWRPSTLCSVRVLTIPKKTLDHFPYSDPYDGGNQCTSGVDKSAWSPLVGWLSP